MARLERKMWLAWALSLSAFTPSCAQRLAPGIREVSVHEYLFGAFGGSALDARDLCASGKIAEFEIHRDAASYLASIASLGLYLPHRVRVRCEPGGRP